MRLDLRFSDRPLDSLWCEAVVVLVFQRHYLTTGVLSGLNKKMAGLLAHLEEKGFWTGTDGENILIASQNMIKAEKILLKGMGQASSYGPGLLRERVREVSSDLDRLNVKDFGIHIPMVEGSEKEYPYQLEYSVHHLVDPFLKNHQNESDFLLKIVFSVDKFFTGFLGPIVGRLRERFASHLEFTGITD